jgi:hypothetical protein
MAKVMLKSLAWAAMWWSSALFLPYIYSSLVNISTKSKLNSVLHTHTHAHTHMNTGVVAIASNTSYWWTEIESWFEIRWRKSNTISQRSNGKCASWLQYQLSRGRRIPGTQSTYLPSCIEITGMRHPDWPQQMDFEEGHCLSFLSSWSRSTTLEGLWARCSVRDRGELTISLKDLKLTRPHMFQMPNACSLWCAALLNISNSYCILRNSGRGRSYLWI